MTRTRRPDPVLLLEAARTDPSARGTSETTRHSNADYRLTRAYLTGWNSV